MTKAEIAPNAGTRAGKKALGFMARKRFRAPVASCAVSLSADGSEKARTAAGRPSRAAASSRDCAASIRVVQSLAAGQPSSTSSSSGPPFTPCAPRGVSVGPAMATTTSAAKAMRRISSHSGVRAGVASGFFRSRMSLNGGKATRRGGGGVTRSR